MVRRNLAIAALLALAGCLDVTVTGSTVAGNPAVTSGGLSGSSTGYRPVTSAGSSTGGASSSGSTSGLPATSSAGSSTGTATSSGTTSGPPMCNGQMLEPPPPFGGPRFSFNVNPALSYGDSVEATSLAGWELRGNYTVDLLAIDGGLLSTTTVKGDTTLTSIAMPLIGPELEELSLSSTQDGVLIQELFEDDAGTPLCTVLDRPCGEHGPCCIGLSCQAAPASGCDGGCTGGCACEYAWPQVPQ